MAPRNHFSRQKLFPLLAGLLLALFSSGCASYFVDVSSLSAGNQRQKEAEASYVILPLNRHVTEKDLQFQEFAGQVENALAELGLRRVHSSAKARLAVMLGYGISDPASHEHVVSVPVYGQVKTGKTVTEGHYDKKTGQYVSTTHEKTTYGITGYKVESYTTTSYKSSLHLEAATLSHAGGKPRPDKQLWQVTASSDSDEGDLRVIFPALLTAAKPYIGLNSGHKVRVEVDAQDTSKIVFMPSN